MTRQKCEASSRLARRGVSKAVSGVSSPQGVERLSMAGPGETLGSPWIPLPIRPWCQVMPSEARQAEVYGLGCPRG
jgi:hypothetical protein